MKFSVVIATFNRAADLAATLESLATLPATRRLGSARRRQQLDGRDARRSSNPPRLRSPHRCATSSSRNRDGSPALNAGIRVTGGDIIVTTDDDVRVDADWLDRAAEGLERLKCDYVGGRVLPIWGAAPPAWLPNRGGKHWAVIALLDYGPEPIEFGARVPLGVNMAFRREAFERAGLFDPGNRAQRRARSWARKCASGASARGPPVLRGFYVPELALRHIIPAARLNKAYFRRWFYWRGISRAMLYEKAGLDMEAPEQTALDFRTVPHVFGVPRYLYRKAIASLAACLRAAIRRDTVARSNTSCGCGSSPASSASGRCDDGARRRPRSGGARCCAVSPRSCIVLDHAIGRLSSRRDVLVELRTPVYHAVLGPIADALADEQDVHVWFTSEQPERVRGLVPDGRLLTHAEVEWRRFDLYVNGDPWAAARLRRCAHRVNFFHGVAGKYDLDSPAGSPARLRGL
jgi:glycosyltransferase involved in cell wall biosynthesis